MIMTKPIGLISPGPINLQASHTCPAWPEDLDYAGKRVIVVGSGATAVTLVPSMAKKTSHMVMLQRSPTYIAAVPEGSLLPKNYAGSCHRPG